MGIFDRSEKKKETVADPKSKQTSREDSGASKLLDSSLKSIAPPEDRWARSLGDQFKAIMDRQRDYTHQTIAQNLSSRPITVQESRKTDFSDYKPENRLAQHLMVGGVVQGRNGGDQEEVRATKGEYVVNEHAAQQNQSMLQGINSGQAGNVKIVEPGPLPHEIGVEFKKIMDEEVRKLEDKLDQVKAKSGVGGDGLTKPLADLGAKILLESETAKNLGNSLMSMAGKGISGAWNFGKNALGFGGDKKDDPWSNISDYDALMGKRPQDPKEFEGVSDWDALMGKKKGGVAPPKSSGAEDTVVEGEGAESASVAGEGTESASVAGEAGGSELALAALAEGGEVPGDPAMGDNIPIKATAGEFVVNKDATQQNKGLLEGINKHFAKGGLIGPDGSQHYAGGGLISGLAGGASDALTAGPEKGMKETSDMLKSVPIVGGMMDSALIGPIREVGSQLESFKQKIFMVSDTFEDLVKRGVDPATQVLAQIAPVINQVAKYNPASVERLSIAFDNLSAAAGKMFSPIITSATDFANNLNVLYTSVSQPIQNIFGTLSTEAADFGREFFVGFRDVISMTIQAAKPLVDALKGSGEEVGGIFRNLMDILATGIDIMMPTFESLGEALKDLVDVVTWVEVAMREAGVAIQEISHRLSTGNVMGVGRPEINALMEAERTRERPQQLEGGRTFAAFQARQTGIEEVGESARASAFSQGRDIPSEQLEVQQQMAETLITIGDLLGEINRASLFGYLVGQASAGATQT